MHKDFSYASYGELLDFIERNEFKFGTFQNHHLFEKVCILRHDVDMSIALALKMATFEAKHKGGVRSTFFFLLRSDFYNLASTSSLRMIQEIRALGHDIGLHFDEKSITGDSVYEAVDLEVKAFEKLTGLPVAAVSMHRPSQMTLEADYQFAGIINTYSLQFFKDFKYLSDSRRNWRESPYQIIASSEYNKLQIVTHPIWYTNDGESARERLLTFVRDGSIERYNHLIDNIRDLEEFITKEEIL